MSDLRGATALAPTPDAADLWHCRRCPQVLGEIVPAGIMTRIRRERDRHQRVIVSALPCAQTCPSCGAENVYPSPPLDEMHR